MPHSLRCARALAHGLSVVLMASLISPLAACGGQQAAKKDEPVKVASITEAPEGVEETGEKAAKDANKQTVTSTGTILGEGIIGVPGGSLEKSFGFEGSGIGVESGIGTKAANPADIKVTTERPCKVMLIAHKDITDDLEYGWWDVWHERKGGDQYFDTPHTFKDVEPGKYILIVYYPDGEPVEGGPGDGAVIQDLNIGHVSELSFDLKLSDFVEWNCLSCPWLYLFDGERYVRAFEILEDVVGRQRKTTRTYPLPASVRQSGRVSLRIQEEKDEITHLDHLALRVGDRTIAPQVSSVDHRANLLAIDDKVVLLKKGDVLNVEFELPDDISDADTLSLVATGHYVPDRAMLAEAFHRLQSLK